MEDARPPLTGAGRFYLHFEGQVQGPFDVDTVLGVLNRERLPDGGAYIRFNVGAGRVHEDWVAGAYLRRRHLTGHGTVAARSVDRDREARQS